MFKIGTLDNVWWVPHLDENGKEYASNFISRALNSSYRGTYDIGYRFLFEGADRVCNLTLEGLKDKAIHFTQVTDTATGGRAVSFREADISDVPSDSTVVKTQKLLLDLGWLVKDKDDEIQLRSDCEQLCERIYGDDVYVLNHLARYSSYQDAHILDGEQVYVESNQEIFHEDNQPNTVHWSEYCGEFVDEDDDYVQYGYISSNGDKGWFFDDDYLWCDDTGYYYANSGIAGDVDGVYYSESYDRWTNKRSYNAEYQSLTRKFKMTPNTTFGIGFEIEKEDDSECEYHYYQDIYDKYGWCKENDGSLDDDYGFELVSPAFDLYTDDLDKEIQSSRALQDMINADYSTSCGGHITVSSSLYSAHEMLEGLSAFFPLLYALYEGRTENDYSRPKEKYKYHTHPQKDAIMSRGNRTIREADHKTFGAIEMRIFSAVRSVGNLLWRRDLVRIMMDNFGKSEKEVLRLLTNPKSKLFRHLTKVYSLQRIVNKITLFASYSKKYNFKIVQVPDQQELLDKFRKAQENNDSTNELGA